MKNYSSKKDTSIKSVFKDPVKFAEVFNKGLFKKEYIKAEDLQEIDTTEIALMKNIAVQRHRDVLKRLYKGKTFAILGLENQTDIDYTMPLRVMGYNFLSYLNQQRLLEQDKKFFSKADKLAPVITLVIYYGETEWKSHQNLWDMLDIPEELKEFVPNFPINIIDVRHLSEKEIESYSGDVKALFGFLAYDKDSKKLEKFVKENAILFEHLPLDVMTAINEYSHFEVSERFIDEKGGANMCKAIEDIRLEGIEEGIEEGIKKVAINLLKKYKSKEEVAELTGLSLEKLSELEKTI